MLKAAKQRLLRVARAGGVFDRFAESQWRTNRLLILAYHGVSLEDEHEWDPALFMPAELLRRRFEILRRRGCNVLSLTEAVERLSTKTLPERAVAITFDDGFYGFYRHAVPLLEEFGFPATLYLTTYYCQHNEPVPAIAASYLSWKGRTEPEPSVDNAEFRRKRLLHLINTDEAAEIAASGIDVQLHTHRHRMPDDEGRFRREISDNRRAIVEATAGAAEESGIQHFCYPSGVHHARHLPWLRAERITSATTCETGLATSDTNPLLLPRLVDSCLLSEVEFEGWLSGVSQFLPQRRTIKR